MARIRALFEFKCKEGHIARRWYPLKTKIDDNDETTCEGCLKKNVVAKAYVVFVSYKEETSTHA